MQAEERGVTARGAKPGETFGIIGEEVREHPSFGLHLAHSALADQGGDFIDAEVGAGG